MALTICGLSALAALRETRRQAGRAGITNECCDLAGDAPARGRRLTRHAIAKELGPYAELLSPDERTPLHVMVGDSHRRPQGKLVRTTLCSNLPKDAFVPLGEGLAMSSPELLFVEMGAVMDPVVHLLLGMELTGRFSRDAHDPRGGDVAYDVPPVTTVARIEALMSQMRGLRGMAQARRVLPLVVENAWSPMEALVAALLVLPEDQLGYDLAPIDLNERHEASERMAAFSAASSRVPDMMVRGTQVGLNYDGKDHFGLQAVAEAAMRVGSGPGDEALARELDLALRDARGRIVADKRRDRELSAQGLAVLPVTYEDLDEEGGLDRVVGLLATALEERAGRNMRMLRALLRRRGLALARQDLIWSLMPGRRATEARRRLEERMRHRDKIVFDGRRLVIEFESVGLVGQVDLSVV